MADSCDHGGGVICVPAVRGALLADHVPRWQPVAVFAQSRAACNDLSPSHALKCAQSHKACYLLPPSLDGTNEEVEAGYGRVPQCTVHPTTKAGDVVRALATTLAVPSCRALALVELALALSVVMHWCGAKRVSS